jgi:hypothetical protein
MWKSSRGLAHLINEVAEPLSSGERFASWSAVALYRFGTAREVGARSNKLRWPAPPGFPI